MGSLFVEQSAGNQATVEAVLLLLLLGWLGLLLLWLLDMLAGRVFS